MAATTPRILLHEPVHVFNQPFFVLLGFGTVALGGTVLLGRGTGPALGNCMSLFQVRHRIPPTRRA